jgi:hypothetical protein
VGDWVNTGLVHPLGLPVPLGQGRKQHHREGSGIRQERYQERYQTRKGWIGLLLWQPLALQLLPFQLLPLQASAVAAVVVAAGGGEQIWRVER